MLHFTAHYNIKNSTITTKINILFTLYKLHSHYRNQPCDSSHFQVLDRWKITQQFIMPHFCLALSFQFFIKKSHVQWNLMLQQHQLYKMRYRHYFHEGANVAHKLIAKARCSRQGTWHQYYLHAICWAELVNKSLRSLSLFQNTLLVILS